MKYSPTSRSVIAAILASLVLPIATTPDATAQGFYARVGPPNFELRANPGERIRELIEIQNDGDQVAEYVVRSADWDLNESGGVAIEPADKPLTGESCRPWVRLERPRLHVAPGQLKRYRFEVHVPASPGTDECRFAVLIGPSPDSLTATDIGGLSVPIAGQVAVIVYVTIGDAAADLKYLGGRIRDNSGKPTPVLRFANYRAGTRAAVRQRDRPGIGRRIAGTHCRTIPYPARSRIRYHPATACPGSG